jgi:hypothetical protein
MKYHLLVVLCILNGSEINTSAVQKLRGSFRYQPLVTASLLEIGLTGEFHTYGINLFPPKAVAPRAVTVCFKGSTVVCNFRKIIYCFAKL